MKKVGMFILIYNSILMLCTSYNWYVKAYPIIDTLDIPIYILCSIVFFKSWYDNFKSISLFDLHCFIFVYCLLALKISYLALQFNYSTYEFWFWLIVSTPILLKIERNLNYENIKRYFTEQRQMVTKAINDFYRFFCR